MHNPLIIYTACLLYITRLRAHSTHVFSRLASVAAAFAVWSDAGAVAAADDVDEVVAAALASMAATGAGTSRWMYPCLTKCSSRLIFKFSQSVASFMSTNAWWDMGIVDLHINPILAAIHKFNIYPHIPAYLHTYIYLHGFLDE